MANLSKVLHALYCQPWLINPTMHRKLCEMAEAHVSGAAHAEGGIAATFKPSGKVETKDTIPVVDGVAIISVNGVVGHKFSSFLNSSGVTSIDVFTRLMNETSGRKDVDAIVLEVDSPGGTVTGVPEAAQAVERANQQKPVIAFAEGQMASAAYWLAVASEAIFTSPSADVGSVGVYLALLDTSRENELRGRKTELFKAGTLKGIGIPGTSLTDEQRAYLQETVDEIYEWFTRDVRSNREVSDETMQGQTFMGARAVDVGLADRIGTIDDAIDFARREANKRK
jgi:signal peptide peptidase SppA